MSWRPQIETNWSKSSNAERHWTFRCHKSALNGEIDVCFGTEQIYRVDSSFHLHHGNREETTSAPASNDLIATHRSKNVGSFYFFSTTTIAKEIRTKVKWKGKAKEKNKVSQWSVKWNRKWTWPLWMLQAFERTTNKLTYIWAVSREVIALAKAFFFQLHFSRAHITLKYTRAPIFTGLVTMWQEIHLEEFHQPLWFNCKQAEIILLRETKQWHFLNASFMRLYEAQRCRKFESKNKFSQINNTQNCVQFNYYSTIT